MSDKIKRISPELADTLNQAHKNVSQWEPWQRSLDPQGSAANPSPIPESVESAREFRQKWSHQPTPIPPNASGLWYSEECVDQLLESYISAERQKRRELEEGLRELCDVLHAINMHPSTNAVYTSAFIHGVEYTGPKYDKALAKADALLTPSTPKPQDKKGGNE